MFSNELPSADDHGTPEWNAKYAELAKVISEKLRPASSREPDDNERGETPEENR